eukprot:360778-Chlamydomonas_euryale.AAC.1
MGRWVGGEFCRISGEARDENAPSCWQRRLLQLVALCVIRSPTQSHADRGHTVPRGSWPQCPIRICNTVHYRFVQQRQRPSPSRVKTLHPKTALSTLLTSSRRATTPAPGVGP